MSQPLSRSERNTSFWGCPTPDNVGPGSYECSLTSPVRNASKLSLAPRPRRLFPTSFSPGPAAYNVTVKSRPGGNKKGSSGFISGQARIAPVAPGTNGTTYPSSFHTPGPGTYEITAKPTSTRSVPKRRVLSDVKRTAASIPVTLPEQSETSPVSYSPSLTLVQKKAGCSSFAASKDRRKLWEPTNSKFNKYTSGENPGPGAYQDPRGGFDMREIRGNASFVSKVPLLHAQKQGAKGLIPGPGAYDLKCHSEIPHELVAFGSKSERGEAWSYSLELPYTRPERLQVPGVGSYDTAYRRRRMRSEAPFSVHQKRDCLTALKRDEQPGPGSYTPDLVSERKPPKPDLPKHPSPERFKSGLFEPKPGPAPGTYYKEKDQYRGKATGPSFKSGSERFKSHLRDNADINVVGDSRSPPPGAYDVRQDWGSPERHRQNISFDSSSRRFRQEEAFPGLKKSQTPGPGMYEPYEGEVKAAVVMRARRFDEHKEQERGPGKYHFENSLIKKSFNYTINPPNERPKLWTLA